MEELVNLIKNIQNEDDLKIIFKFLESIDRTDINYQAIYRYLFHTRKDDCFKFGGEALNHLFGYFPERVSLDSTEYVIQTKRIIQELFELDIPDPIMEKEKLETKKKTNKKKD